MTMVTIEVRCAIAHRAHAYSQYLPKTNTYTGELVDAPKWHPNAVCITTGDLSFPVRTIDRDRVLSITGAVLPPVKSTKKTAKNKTKTFSVEGSKGKKYTVTLDGNQASCTCPGFQFRKTCKHVTEILKSY